MKKPLVHLKVDKPCHANWNEMLPEEQGKFCQSCEKVVVDFSWMSDAQIIQKMEEMVNVSVCGRFEPSQLNRNLNESTAIYSGSFDLKSILMGAAFSTLISLSVYSQSAPITVVGESVKTPICKTDTLDYPIMGDTIMIYQHPKNGEKQSELKGTVMSLASSPLRKAIVNVFDQNDKLIQSIKTDDQGVFQMALDWSKQPQYMVVSYGTTVSEYYDFRFFEELNHFRIVLPIGPFIKGKVVKD